MKKIIGMLIGVALGLNSMKEEPKDPLVSTRLLVNAADTDQVLLKGSEEGFLKIAETRTTLSDFIKKCEGVSKEDLLQVRVVLEFLAHKAADPEYEIPLKKLSYFKEMKRMVQRLSVPQLAALVKTLSKLEVRSSVIYSPFNHVAQRLRMLRDQKKGSSHNHFKKMVREKFSADFIDTFLKVEHLANAHVCETACALSKEPDPLLANDGSSIGFQTYWNTDPLSLTTYLRDPEKNNIILHGVRNIARLIALNSYAKHTALLLSQEFPESISDRLKEERLRTLSIYDIAHQKRKWGIMGAFWLGAHAITAMPAQHSFFSINRSTLFQYDDRVPQSIGAYRVTDIITSDDLQIQATHDGNYVVIVDNDPPAKRVRVFDLRTNSIKEVRYLRGLSASVSTMKNSVLMSEEMSDESPVKINIWNWSQGDTLKDIFELPRSIVGHNVTCRISPRGTHIACLSPDQGLSLWSVDQLRKKGAKPLTHSRKVWYLANPRLEFTPTSNHLVYYDEKRKAFKRVCVPDV